MTATCSIPAYEPFWAAVQELNVPVAIHEGTTMNVPTAGADRFENHWFRHMISHPHEMQIACMSLIGGGVLERYPELRIVFLESGSGWLPHWLERMDEHVESFHWLVRGLTMKPSEYFNRQGVYLGRPAGADRSRHHRPSGRRCGHLGDRLPPPGRYVPRSRQGCPGAYRHTGRIKDQNLG